MSRVLVVANETVEADELLAELRRIEDQQDSVFRAQAVRSHPGSETAGALGELGICPLAVADDERWFLASA